MGWGQQAEGGSLGTDPERAAVAPRLSVVDETDGYIRSVAGVTIEAVRAGRGVGPNAVLGIPGPRHTVTSSSIGFPILTRSHIAEGRVVATFVHETPGDSRWCGIPLRPGMVVVYGPGAEHAALNRPGLRFSFVITELDRLREFARRLDAPFEAPPHGGVLEFGRRPATAALGSVLEKYAAARAPAPVEKLGDDVLAAFVGLLDGGNEPRSVGRGKGVDSRAVVQASVEFAETTERIPSIGELCLAAHVSERRLRDAFTEEFDQPPSRFFRSWALEEAHRQLLAARPDRCTVTDVAMKLGFAHLGRFAGHYRRLYGECPSATLRSAAPLAS